MKQIRRHLTYANVMSSIAVFFVLSGATAFAATKIGANQLKANSVKTGKIVKEAVTAGKIKSGAVGSSKLANGAVTTDKLADNAVTTAKIANDAVTGEKVNESTLGQVPSAANANTVGGNSVKKLLFATDASANAQSVFSANGLSITASCVGGVLSATANTSVNDALIHSGGTFLIDEPFYEEDDNFDTGNNFDFLNNALTGSDSVQGTLTYTAPNGNVVTAVFQAEEDALGLDCTLSGYATS